MHLLAYNALFKELARTHVAIQATPANNRFIRILVSSDIVQKQLDLNEFYGFLKNKLKAPEGQPFLVAENYQADYSDNQGDYFSRDYQGAYLVLQKVKPGDFDARDVAIDASEEIAEDLLAAVIQKLRAQHNARITVADAFCEHIGPVADGYVGARMNLSWSAPATPALTYNPEKFLS
jgi:hypothetical protein